MIGEEDENIVAGTSVEDFLALGGSLVAFQNGQKVFRGDISFAVIDFDSLVNVNAGFREGGFIENFSFVGVVDAGGNVVIGEGDDVIWIETVIDEHLIGVEDIRLMSIVRVAV